MEPYPPNQQEQEDGDVRRGPWTLDEDNLLIHYVTRNGEGKWNLVAKSAGLKRTGKSCRLRWLNYLKPDIKRGNLTPQEQLVILELHSKWGNKWSKIAQHLPGRTDNEIKNYWRTRVQKQARQLNMESNSQSFFEAIRCFFMPRLLQKIEQNSFPSANMDSQESGASFLPLQESMSSSFPPSKPEVDNHTDQFYMDYSSSSLNPVEGSIQPSNPLNGCTPGDVPQWKDDAAFPSEENWYNVYNSYYEMKELPYMSDAYVADDMADDPWNMGGLW